MAEKTITDRLQASSNRLEGLSIQASILQNEMLDLLDGDMKNTSNVGNDISLIGCKILFEQALPILREMQVDLNNCAKVADQAYLEQLKVKNAEEDEKCEKTK